MADRKEAPAAKAGSKAAKSTKPKTAGSKNTTGKGYTAPTKSETITETHTSYRDRFLAWPIWVKIVAVVTILILISLLVWGCWAIWFNHPAGSSGRPDGTAANAVSQPDGVVEPAISTGVTSWTSWGKYSLNNSDMESSMLEAHSAKYHQYYAEMVQGEKQGKSYAKMFPKGTRFINCDYNVVNDGRYVFFWDTLKKDTWFLCFPDGEPAVKMTCGNTVIFRESEAKKPGKPGTPPPTTVTKCPPAPPGFSPRTPDGGSKVFQSPQAGQETAKAADPAKSLVRGVPEAIAADQTAKSGSTQSTQKGAVSLTPPPANTPADDGKGNVTVGTVSGL